MQDYIAYWRRLNAHLQYDQNKREAKMLTSQSSELRTKLWQSIRSRQIQQIKQHIRQLYNAQEKDEKLKQEAQDVLATKRDKSPQANCELCVGKNECALVDWIWHLMREGRKLCCSHERQIIEECMLHYKNNPFFVAQLYAGIDILTANLVVLQRSLYLVSQILTLFLAHDQTHSSQHEESLDCCPIVQYILEGWFEYRLSEIAQQLGHRVKQSSIRVLEMLLKECRKTLVAQFLWIVAKRNWKIIQEMMFSSPGERILGLSAILYILSNIRDKEYSRIKFCDPTLKVNIKRIILEQIVNKTSLHYLELSPEATQLETQIVYLSLQVDDEHITLREHRTNITKWVENLVHQMPADRLSQWSRQTIGRMLAWGRANGMEQQ